jgi:hypothetical protein
MITPSPTTALEVGIARGTLLEVVAETATRAAYIKFAVPNTNYELHLRPTGPIQTPPGKRLIGVIRAQARRIDVVETGGEYIEPVYGRPRRVQGTVLRTEGGAIVVDAGAPIHCTPTDPRQKADQFSAGQFVSFDVLDGASFEPRVPKAG